jgi:hypothetical protein
LLQCRHSENSPLLLEKKIISIRMDPVLVKALSLSKQVSNEYTHIDDVDDLILGRYIRWVYTDDLKKLYPGGILLSVDPKTNVLLCKNRNRLFNISFDVAIVLQKMSLDERIIRQARLLARS